MPELSSMCRVTMVQARRINPNQIAFFTERRRPRMKKRTRFFKRKLYSINITIIYADSCAHNSPVNETLRLRSQSRKPLTPIQDSNEIGEEVESYCGNTLTPQPERRRPAKATKPRASHCQNSKLHHLICTSRGMCAAHMRRTHAVIRANHCTLCNVLLLILFHLWYRGIIESFRGSCCKQVTTIVLEFEILHNTSP